ncbi:MAG: SWIM zinc finger family protein [Acidobacteriota bacterium]
MNLAYRYRGRSGVMSERGRSRVALATNTLREATFFRGTLADPLPLREGLGALHEVVVSDFRYHPKDRLAFKAWLEEQDRKFLRGLGLTRAEVRHRYGELEARLAELDASRLARMRPFFDARREYFEYAYQHQYELAFVLDPVVTIHPDELCFEAFSKDESSYARLATRYDVFRKVEAFECGTTNIDFSTGLHDQFDRMRTYRETAFDVDAGGFAATTGDVTHVEKKIEMPDSWVMGFLQVQSVMTMALVKLPVAPVDLFNVCRELRRRRARRSPRALRWELVPGERVRVVLEPWEKVIELSASAIWQGVKAQTIRTWGRDRLRTIARLLPIARTVDVYLAGFGMPSIYVLDLGNVIFTLALSGWTDNDWCSDAGKFDLLARRREVTADELAKVREELTHCRSGSPAALALATGLPLKTTQSALGYLCQVGQGMYDLGSGVFRHRELFLEPFEVKNVALLDKASESAEAKAARAIVESGEVRIIARRPVKDGFKVSGSARGAASGRMRPLIHVDRFGQLVTASCTCPRYHASKLTKGPCEHILALRLAHMKRVAEEGGAREE